jgi:hypothetical protein
LLINNQNTIKNWCFTIKFKIAMNYKLRKEEYLPAGTFLATSFLRDRLELSSRFIEFTPDYEARYQKQLQKVDALEQPYKMTEAQKKVTLNLNLAASEMSNELNFLSFYFKRAALDPAILTAIKKDINRHNIEGACLKIKGLIDFIKSENVVLESKGMAVSYPEELQTAKADLEAKNALQNEIMNNKKQLYENNKTDYDALYDFIKTITGAGKIFYNGVVKADEYTVTKMISRMRGGGGGTPPPTPPAV